MKPTKDEKKERMDAFKCAIKSVIERINPQTLGPCHYCEWPITKCCHSTQFHQGRLDNMVLVCDLCLKFTDTIFTRRWEDEEPAAAI